jgi:hypothetical protein
MHQIRNNISNSYISEGIREIDLRGGDYPRLRETDLRGGDCPRLSSKIQPFLLFFLALYVFDHSLLVIPILRSRLLKRLMMMETLGFWCCCFSI